MTLRKLLILCTFMYSGSATADFIHFKCDYSIPDGNVINVGWNYISVDVDTGVARVDGQEFSGSEVEIGTATVQVKEQKTKMLPTRRTYIISRLDLSYQNNFLDFSFPDRMKYARGQCEIKEEDGWVETRSIEEIRKF